jgi:hypothetical protein
VDNIKTEKIATITKLEYKLYDGFCIVKILSEKTRNIINANIAIIITYAYFTNKFIIY